MVELRGKGDHSGAWRWRRGSAFRPAFGRRNMDRRQDLLVWRRQLGIRTDANRYRLLGVVTARGDHQRQAHRQHTRPASPAMGTPESVIAWENLHSRLPDIGGSCQTVRWSKLAASLRTYWRTNAQSVCQLLNVIKARRHVSSSDPSSNVSRGLSCQVQILLGLLAMFATRPPLPFACTGECITYNGHARPRIPHD